jgi:16S rRNA (cytosine1402-N4)-methyltransferase
MNATMSLDNKKHYPVMLDQVLSIISPQHGGTFIDCTFGGGGYSRAILKYPGTKVFAIDRDKITEHYANDLSKKFPDRFNFFRSKFSNLNQVIHSNINPKAIIFDLGLSSIQLLDNQRSFSFNSKSFLSMEMGINKYTAYNVINSLDKRYLSNIIKIFGEEKDGKIIANAINKHRIKNLIKTSEELSKIIKSAKKNYNNFKKNPATRTFQAIRIFVNQELTELILGLIEATRILKKDGILIVVSFHSLEDKIVKYFFNLYSNLKKNPSRYLPSKENKSQLFKLLSKKPLIPSQEEIHQNKSSRSAKLRYVIRNDNSFFYPKEFKNKFQDYFNLEAINL